MWMMRRRGAIGAFAFAALCASAAEAQAPAPPPDPAAPTAAPKPAGLTLQVGDASIRFYGGIRLDLHVDDSHPNNSQLIVCILSEDETAPRGIGAKKNAEDLTLHARNTRFGVDIASAPISALGDATVGGKVEFDFLANGGSEAAVISRGVIRLRQAYVKFGWDDVSVLAGQTWDVISPLNPVVNPDFVMWGAGNTGDRRPMVQVDYRPALAAGHRLLLQGEVGLAGAVDGKNLDLGTTTTATRDGEASGLPCFMGRLGYKGESPWVEKAFVEAGVWGYWAKDHVDAPAVAGLTRDDFRARAVGLDLTLPLWDLLEIRGELWRGKNSSDIRGGILQGISTVGGGTEIESRGCWGEVVVKACPFYTVHLGVSRDNPVNGDIAVPGAAANAPAGAMDNRVCYWANRFNAGGGVSFGFDVLHWVTRWQGGYRAGVDNRFSWFVMYAF
jgi:hypothetical protein